MLSSKQFIRAQAMTVYYRFDRPWIKKLTYPYVAPNNSIQTAETFHNCAIAGDAVNASFNTPGADVNMLEDIQNVAAYLVPIWWDLFGITRGAFPVIGLGAQYDRITW